MTIPDDSLNYQLLERNQMQDNLPHLPLPTPSPRTPILISLVVFPWLFLGLVFVFCLLVNVIWSCQWG